MTRRIAFALCATLVVMIAGAGLVRAQEIDWEHFNMKKATPEERQRVFDFIDRNAANDLRKVNGSMKEIKSLIIRGNKITTVVYNYGTITRPNTLSNVADLVWNRLGYGYEFTPLVACQVVDTSGNTVHILDDGNYDPLEGGYSPDLKLKWGWLPKPGYAAPSPNEDIAAWSARSDNGGDLTRKPHSWPESWYNPVLGRYVWPSFLGNDATTPDEEVYFVCDDYTNMKYPYYPFPDDSTKRGLGLDLECRFFQFNNPLAEDIIFLVYRVTNKSPKTLHRVYFGMYGDPHIGGALNFDDDLAGFIPPRGADPSGRVWPQRARSMVYAWDFDGRGDGGLIPGYFGFKFLESPTNSNDGIDNDDDGVIDESPFNDAGFYIDGVTTPLTYGISDTVKYRQVYGPPRPRWSGDEDGDWDPLKDDVGIDGIPGTGDFGEKNGRPDIGYDANGNLTSEPNFGIRDVHESDQIGLTSFWALPYGGGNNPKNDDRFWPLLSTDTIAINQELFNTPGDNIFLYGSGPFDLGQNGTQRFSIALLMGENLADLVLNSETAQRVLEANYRFAQPPPKPKVHAVAGDGRVSLFWDDGAERAEDPLTGVNDFEGYKVYRSEDYTFSDVYKITDANGSPFLGLPLVGSDGTSAQFDLVNGWSGLAPVEYTGRGVKYFLGNNTGLVHEYVDSTVTNGKTYYYAVASYDHGFDTLGVNLPPTESQIAIIRDPITGVLTFDQNTLVAVPGPLPIGTVKASLANGPAPKHIEGVATGDVVVKIMDDLAVPANETYAVNFRKEQSTTVYDVEIRSSFTDHVLPRDTFFVSLSRKQIIDSSFVMKDRSGNVIDNSRYYLDAPGGRFRGISSGSLPNDTVLATYRYYPLYQSTFIKGEDNNTVFDGMRLYATDDPVGLDSIGSGWTVKQNTTIAASIGIPSLWTTFRPAPLDIEIVWNRTDTTANGKWLYPGDTLLNNNGRKVVVCPFKIYNKTYPADPPLKALVNLALKDSVWRPGREIAFITPVRFSPSQNPIPGMISVHFDLPASGESILPTQGDTYVARTTKPFTPADRYEFTSQAVSFDLATASNQLNNIYVVPNPYVAFSYQEQPGSSATLRGENRLQFRNLPAVCTIRIYTITGELVDTIEKNDTNSYANWRILSYEGQRLAYGVYLYHVDVPGVGEKIGRFALIK